MENSATWRFLATVWTSEYTWKAVRIPKSAIESLNAEWLLSPDNFEAAARNKCDPIGYLSEMFSIGDKVAVAPLRSVLRNEKASLDERVHAAFSLALLENGGDGAGDGALG